MEIRLNIYDGKTVKKTYTAEGINLTLGAVEDFLRVLDECGGEIAVSGLPEAKSLLCEVFEGITEDEIRNTRVDELTLCILEIFNAAGDAVQILTQGKKAKGMSGASPFMKRFSRCK